MKKLMVVLCAMVMSFNMAVPAFASTDKMNESALVVVFDDCAEWAKAHYDDSLWDMPEYERYNYLVDYVVSNIELMSNEEILANPVHIDPATGKGGTFSMTSALANLAQLCGLDAINNSMWCYDHAEGVVSVNIDGVTYYTSIAKYAMGNAQYKCSSTIWADHNTDRDVVVHDEFDEYGPSGIKATDAQ